MRSIALVIVLWAASAMAAPPACPGVVDHHFAEEVWAKVAATKCLICHKAGGEAAESKLVFLDPAKAKSADAAMATNRDALLKMALLKENDSPRLMKKVVGGLTHGGGEILKPGSAEYRILAAFVRRANAPSIEVVDDPKQPPFFHGVAMVDDRTLIRRVTLSLAGRLPTKDETDLAKVLDTVMTEEAFYTRLREAFNDVFLTLGVDGNPDQNVLSYDHFPNRLWYQKHDLSAIKDETARRQAGYKLANDYRRALLDEPMRLIDHIVRNDKPFTEIVTADYIMVSPYTARGYSVFDQLIFKNPDDPFEYVPVKLKALVARNKPDNQDSASGFYPHAGVLSTFQYLARYPTTETNRNRLRARMYYQHFLGIDVLELAARGDAAAVTAKYPVPTMQASECVVCHKTLDPVAGLFQDYWRFAERGIYGKRKGGWFTDMFPAGFEGEPLPENQRWRSLQWLGERTAEDPRFAVAMTEHAYYLLTGRRLLLPPKDLDDPQYAAKRRAYVEQRRVTQIIAADFTKKNFNFKKLLKAWIASDFYRVDATRVVKDRAAEMEDVGVVRLLSPEQLERKIEAVFGERWGKLTDQTAKLYGSIDSKEVTERAADPSGAMGAVQRTLANDVAAKHVARDFAKPAHERRLFPGIEPDTQDETKLRAAVVYLHAHILGRHDATDSEEVTRTLKLFTDIVSDAKQRKFDKRDTVSKTDDPTYSLRAWRAVVTYLLRRPEFLYE